MGVVVVDRSGIGNPAIEASAVEAAAVEEEAEIEEIVHLEKKTWHHNASVLQGNEATSGCSTKKTTQTGPSANYSEQLII
jgi:hypothetical protein